ncbi:MAG TPA: hypothetical protein VHC92_05075 [Rhodanobacteraceae bacterium]|jgi:hypothetical protein|nr:hypothetical protein [Rhodanobacteraceae bacterium]
MKTKLAVVREESLKPTPQLVSFGKNLFHIQFDPFENKGVDFAEQAENLIGCAERLLWFVNRDEPEGQLTQEALEGIELLMGIAKAMIREERLSPHT